jgi:hypothetical protein
VDLDFSSADDRHGVRDERTAGTDGNAGSRQMEWSLAETDTAQARDVASFITIRP